MRSYNHGRFQQQASFLRRQFLQDGDLPFTDVLSEGIVAQALTATSVVWLDRIYSPLVTLWVFLGQVLSADHSCRAAVARLIAHRLSRGQRPCSATTGAYCQARKRLPEQFFAAVACLVGRALDAKVDSQWLWKGRRVYMFDGTTVSMPDTPENQAAYPQVYNQKPGLGFPIARIGVITSLACGAVLNLGFCRYAGKGQGEVSLLRRLWDVLRPGDVLLADSLLSNWTGIVLLQERGVDLVSRLNKAHRKADFRRGIRLGHDDHIVRWHKPTSIRSVDRRTYNSLPEYVTIREARFRVEQPWIQDEGHCRGDDLAGPAGNDQGGPGQLCIVPAGTTSSICGRSSRRCKWTCCAARRRNSSAKRSGRTFSPTISSARSWRRRRRSTAWSRERSASKERCKRWKRFSR